MKDLFEKYPWLKPALKYLLAAIAGAQGGPAAGHAVQSYGPSVLNALAKILGG